MLELSLFLWWKQFEFAIFCYYRKFLFSLEELQTRSVLVSQLSFFLGDFIAPFDARGRKMGGKERRETHILFPLFFSSFAAVYLPSFSSYADDYEKEPLQSGVSTVKSTVWQSGRNVNIYIFSFVLQ